MNTPSIWRVRLPDGRHVNVSRHALDRWQEYVCPGRTRMFARQFLERMAVSEGVLGRPDWLRVQAYEEDGQQQLYLMIGDFVLVIVLDDSGEPKIATTVIARGCVLPSVREARRRARDGRRSYRRSHSPTGQQEARRGDRRRRRDRQAPSIDD